MCNDCHNKTFATERPDESAEWDYERNGNVTPDRIPPQSNKKYWWKCPDGHSYEASPASRYRGRGCPICSGSKIVPGINSLLAKHPDLIAEWNYDKNDKSPDEIAPNNSSDVWWKCKEGHEWQAPPSRRVSLGSGCPYCHGKKAIIGQNDLMTVSPELATEWDYEKNTDTPADYLPQANKKKWWKCEQHGHSYEASIASRYNGAGCPYCAGRKVLAGFNDLASLRPDVAAEWNHEKNGRKTPNMFTWASSKKAWWKCPDGHEWEASIANRTKNNSGCPYCSGRKAIAGENDLTITHPEIAAEWDYEKNANLTPSEVKSASNKKAWWVCEHGHSYEATVYHRAERHQKCPYCSGRKVLAGYNSIADTHPALLSEWDYDKNEPSPSDVTAGTNRKAWWVCPEGHSYQTSISNKTRENPTRCPICAGKTVVAGINSLSTTHPEIADEWNYDRNTRVTPDEVTAGSNRRVWWKCEHGHEWATTIAHRTRTGCPECSKHRRSSQPEQGILYYVSQFEKAINGYKIQGNRELDIFLPNMNVGIEYDGSYYHSDTEKDLEKDKLCNELGITLYRIREPLCPDLDSTSICLYRQTTYLDDDLNQVIEHLVLLLFGIEIQADVVSRRNEILAMLASRSLENSLSNQHPVLARQWDYEKNAPLSPENISSSAREKYWWRCPRCGHRWQAAPGVRGKHKRLYGKCPSCGHVPDGSQKE